MLENKYGCLPVLEQGALLGILTEADFVRIVAEAPVVAAARGAQRSKRGTGRG
jgi:CBS domain-containing protein